MKTLILFLFTLIGVISFTQVDSVKNYYKRIAFGNEFNGDISGEKKWNTDVKIFIIGVPDADLSEELTKILKELNDLIDPIELSITNNRAEANVIVLFGSKSDFIELDSRVEPYVKYNEGLFMIEYINGEIDYGEMYVNTKGKLTTKEKKHILREELTQLLGLCNDSYMYKNSIFYQGWSDGTEYAQIDKELIKLLYNNKK